jgi:hypothetical protein
MMCVAWGLVGAVNETFDEESAVLASVVSLEIFNVVLKSFQPGCE